ncbi:MAG: hypothetical protein IJ766_08125 [Clostridia bacterium]|nr:hypothetical protein [Clostridia bacterium]
MPKKGMKRPNRTHTQPRNAVAPVPELQGKAKHGKTRANPVISGTDGTALKVFHTERPIPADVYPTIDTDLARDNLENDLSAADRQDL